MFDKQIQLGKSKFSQSHRLETERPVTRDELSFAEMRRGQI